MENQLDTLLKEGHFTKENIKTDSRSIKPGDVFIAIRGTLYDGHDFIPTVIEKGASYIVAEKAMPELFQKRRNKFIIVEDTRTAFGCITRHVFGNPSESLLTFGVTGTNGKTTTVFLIDTILNNVGIACGFISTVFAKTKENKLRPSSMTTPNLVELNTSLLEMLESGKKAAVIEVSSHALDQERICGISLDSAVFTNITPEHLDYHKGMKSYLNAKAKIFNKLKPKGIAAVNIDDPMISDLSKELKGVKLIKFGLSKKADVRAENIKIMIKNTEFDLIVKGKGETHICAKLIGRHNIYNMLGAVAALSNRALSLEKIKNSLEKAAAVPGRLETVSHKAPFSIFIDYAHTPNAIESVLQNLRPLTHSPRKRGSGSIKDKPQPKGRGISELTKARLICVFGCGGDRDKSKRPVMGEIAARLCDYVILTNDNPRTEKPMDILKQIEKGIVDKNNYTIIEERRKAIRKALEMASLDDIVVIAGKGHEDYQIIGDKKTHFNDREIAHEVLKELGYGAGPRTGPIRS